MILSKIISGGQTGVDQAALFAAKALGLETGGWMPKDYKTDDGPRPDLARQFGLIATQSSSYVDRTKGNVFYADGTLIFGRINSPGCKLTRKFIAEFNRPSYIIRWPSVYYLLDDSGFRTWLLDKKITILNVVGNREGKNPGIFDAVKAFLVTNISILKQWEAKP